MGNRALLSPSRRPKHQAPTTKLQGSSKSQAPIGAAFPRLGPAWGSHKRRRSRSTSRRRLKFGAWGGDALFEKSRWVSAVSSGIIVGHAQFLGERVGVRGNGIDA